LIDGDTIEIAGARVRLHGIDAPEAGQKCTDAGGVAYPCGERATRSLRALIDGQSVTVSRPTLTGTAASMRCATAATST
jgi:endonuclease YncB( thermonuclease family)